MPTTKCSAPSCEYETEDGALADRIELLRLHVQVAHPAAAGASVAGSAPAAQCKAKLESPRLSTGSSQETWDMFLRDWRDYKAAMKITQNVTVFLLNCLEGDLRQDVCRAHPEQDVVTENTLLETIKSLAVIIESELVHRIKMTSTNQTPGSSVRNYLTTLKGIAKHCRYFYTCPNSTCARQIDYSSEMIKDQIVKGLSDRDIVADLLGDVKKDRTLEEVVDFIDRKEQGKTEHNRVTGDCHAAMQS